MKNNYKTTQKVNNYKIPTNTNVKGALGGLAFLTATLASSAFSQENKYDATYNLGNCGILESIHTPSLNGEKTNPKLVHTINGKKVEVEYTTRNNFFTFGKTIADYNINCGNGEKRATGIIEYLSPGRLTNPEFVDTSSIGSNDKGSGKSSTGGGSGSSSGEDFGGGDAGGGDVDITP